MHSCTTRRNGATSSCRPTWQGIIGLPKTSWLSTTGGPLGDHRGRGRRRRGPEVSRVPDCKILTDQQRHIVKAARSTFLRQRNGGAGAAPDRTAVVTLLWDDLLGGAQSTKTEGGDVLPVATPSKGRRGAGNT